MKDIIYVNQTLINSILAQKDEGLAIGSKYSDQNSESVTKVETEGVNTNAGFSSIIKATVEGNSESSTSNQLTKSASKYLDTVLDDYSLNLLIEKLNLETKTNISQTVEGDFVSITDNFSVIDMSILKNMTDDNSIIELTKLSDDNYVEYEKLNKIPKKSRTAEITTRINTLKKSLPDLSELDRIFKMVNLYAKFYNGALPNTTLFSSNDSIVLANIENLRITPAELTAISKAQRKLNVFGIVSSIKGDLETSVTPDGKNIDFSVMSTFFMDVVLGSFNILKKGDRIIKPIAVFYE